MPGSSCAGMSVFDGLNWADVAFELCLLIALLIPMFDVGVFGGPTNGFLHDYRVYVKWKLASVLCRRPGLLRPLGWTKIGRMRRRR